MNLIKSLKSLLSMGYTFAEPVSKVVETRPLPVVFPFSFSNFPGFCWIGNPFQLFLGIALPKVHVSEYIFKREIQIVYEAVFFCFVFLPTDCPFAKAVV